MSVCRTCNPLVAVLKRVMSSNIMIADDGSPILMDFGSTVKYGHTTCEITRSMLLIWNMLHRARIMIENRQQALVQQVRIFQDHITYTILTSWCIFQDIAAEHSTMPYRAPELFDVKSGKMLDEKVDIWVSPCLCCVCLYLVDLFVPVYSRSDVLYSPSHTTIPLSKTQHRAEAVSPWRFRVADTSIQQVRHIAKDSGQLIGISSSAV